MNVFNRFILILACLLLSSTPGHTAFISKKTASESPVTGIVNSGYRDQQAAALSAGSHSFTSRFVQKIAHFLPRKKSQSLASILALVSLLTGVMGLARFYLGYNKEGMMQLAGTFLGGIGILVFVLALIDIIPPAFIGISIAGISIFWIDYIWQFIDFIRICIGDLGPAGKRLRHRQ